MDIDNGIKQHTRFYRDINGRIVTRSGALAKGMDYFTDSKKFDFPSEFLKCQKPMLMIFGKEDDDLVTRHFMEESILRNPMQKIIEVSGGHLFSRNSLKGEVREKSIMWLGNLLLKNNLLHNFD
jgi:hypothetical protein